jgi:hypothetical protein
MFNSYTLHFSFVACVFRVYEILRYCVVTSAIVMTVDGSNLPTAADGQTETNCSSLPLDHKVRLDKVTTNRVDGCLSDIQYVVAGGPFKGVIVNKAAMGLYKHFARVCRKQPINVQ